jgi:hypothetical protein
MVFATVGILMVGMSRPVAVTLAVRRDDKDAGTICINISIKL